MPALSLSFIKKGGFYHPTCKYMQRKIQEMASKVDRTPEELSYKPLMDEISNNMSVINSRQELKLKEKKEKKKSKNKLKSVSTITMQL